MNANEEAYIKPTAKKDALLCITEIHINDPSRSIDKRIFKSFFKITNVVAE